ncbi:sensor histidine kinase [Athalassotoga saccharophila]|uniref:sensor histidine kinase n=1 Tax=Athalassotoga saccharophila TaxID=1441386 RepID=UPI001379628F|nr:HAMP domain-containing sensor histidine kinase [Athalassotoga saccharophila]BBJ28623.1 sensor protein BasS [Athalassotoga saccharophila]
MKSIRFKVIIWFSVTISAVFLVIGFLIYNLQLSTSYKTFDDYLISNANRAANYFKNLPDNSVSIQAFINNIGISDVSYYIFDSKDNLIFSFAPDQENDLTLIKNAFKKYLLIHEKILTLEDSNGSGENIQQSNPQRIFVLPFEKGGENYYLVASRQMEEFRSTNLGISYWLLIGLIIAFIIIMSGGLLIISKALKPIEEMSSQVKRIKTDNLSERINVKKSAKEIEILEQSINSALDRIESGVKTIERFSSIAAHELKTPISVIKSDAQIAMKKNSIEELKNVLAKISQKSDEMSKLIDTLLLISKVKNVPVNFENLNVNEITFEAVEDLIRQYPDRIEFLPSGNSYIKGDESLLKEMIFNVVENSCKYTDRRVKIEIGNNCITVSDEGPGMDEETKSHLFEEFFRKRTDVPGFGLGLSVVKYIADLHGIKIHVDSSPIRGTKINFIWK